ncbi:phosphatidate cytidylyltransferase photoreceptor-specific [Anaeramoeba ignava]|uniref:Phosphatidate cytidylyltransferase n=1 Tax=Anaeramoeba ignava TaxID=1746090 RepID=A0A9Q0RA74_ANAIG|nr:phosphatidate cytidylyltransferase photoreceptor-specific [Anaeramoeba ignava]
MNLPRNRKSKNETIKKNEQKQEEQKQEEPKQEEPKQEEAKKPAQPSRARNFIVRTISTFTMFIILYLFLSGGHMGALIFISLLTIASFKEAIDLGIKPEKEKHLPFFFKFIPWIFLLTLVYFLYGKLIIKRYSKFYYEGFKSVSKNSTLDSNSNSNPNSNSTIENDIDLHTLFLQSEYEKLINTFFVNKFIYFLIRYHNFISYSLYIFTFIVFVASLRSGYYKYQFRRLSFCVMALFLGVLQSNWFVSNVFDGLIWFFLPIFLIFINDIGAYLSGITFGKTPLIKLSPKKTWEGFIGAFIITIVLGFFTAGFLSKFDYLVCPYMNPHCQHDLVFVPTEYPLPDFVIKSLSFFGIVKTTITLIPLQLHSLSFSIFASLIAPFGGFFASGLKRAMKIKDFGDTIPGHGGFIDRLDCEMVMGCFSYLYYNTFIKQKYPNVISLFFKVAVLNNDDLLLIFEKIKLMLIERGLI